MLYYFPTITVFTLQYLTKNCQQKASTISNAAGQIANYYSNNILKYYFYMYIVMPRLLKMENIFKGCTEFCNFIIININLSHQ